MTSLFSLPPTTIKIITDLWLNKRLEEQNVSLVNKIAPSVAIKLNLSKINIFLKQGIVIIEF